MRMQNLQERIPQDIMQMVMQSKANMHVELLHILYQLKRIVIMKWLILIHHKLQISYELNFS